MSNLYMWLLLLQIKNSIKVSKQYKNRKISFEWMHIVILHWMALVKAQEHSLYVSIFEKKQLSRTLTASNLASISTDKEAHNSTIPEPVTDALFSRRLLEGDWLIRYVLAES